MGKPTNVYRDQPDDAVSLHTTRGVDNDALPFDDDAPEISDLPPAYTDDVAGPGLPEASQQAVHQAETVGSLVGKPINEFKGVQAVMDPRCDTDPVHLEDRIRRLAKIAPYPTISINGHHQETVRNGDKKETKHVTDFNIVLDIRQYLFANYEWDNSSTMDLRVVENEQKTFRGSFKKSRGHTNDPEAASLVPGLTEWCHRYCASHSNLKVFRLTRTVTGFDEELMCNRIEGLIRSTNYRGHTNITFPITNRAVDIYSTNRINTWRLTSWIRWLFYLTFLWLFAWPYLYFATKRFAVVTAYWRFSTSDPATGQKVYTTMSEEQLFSRWQSALKRLVLDRYQGNASEEFLREVGQRPANQRFASGNEPVDTAVNFLQAGFRAVNEVDRMLSGRPDGWGGDC